MSVPFSLTCYPETHMREASKINAAVILCGCGRGDGSEIHEATSILIHLARLGIGYRCFAPDKPQVDVVDHANGDTPTAERRNCLTESARIARGEVTPLSELDASGGAGFDCLFFPGGFGAAKNLITFAKEGTNATVDPVVERVFGAFHSTGKPIGLCCIAPVIAAKLLGAGTGAGVTITLGQNGGAADVVQAWGSRHEVSAVEQAVVDRAHKVVTSPAYMYGDASPWQVYQGIGRMVEETVALCSK